MNKHLNIKEWKEEDRPREKFLLKGAQSLSDVELLAIIIGSGNACESAVELSQRILHSVEYNLDELGKQSIQSLIKNFKGIGNAKAITIAAAMELGRRRKVAQPAEKKKVLASEDVFEVLHSKMADLPHEEFWMLLLNRANKIIGQVKLTQGGTGQTVVEIPLVLKTAIDKLAAGIIVGHNHPSGNIEPSQQDIKITQKLSEACKIVDISLLDHLIIGHKTYYSFADNGML
ncbi:RadC family protein [Paludibacter jiangxiensis]|uniref:DNA repair protein RadC n=1 Tax=Paludibacter jiangxiensis TaxID=681398 RepID=A0A161L894_9BACT|nr:DNA repair protein RadC [Paludibacter jiangxiensis]GAT63274.1 DNA repair protein RadC [Paludibacter jiangxiensis]